MKDHASLIDTREDAVNIDLGVAMPNHLPFEHLHLYYDGAISRPPGRVGQDEGKSPRAMGHSAILVTQAFGETTEEQLKDTPFDQGVFVGKDRHKCTDMLGAHMRLGPQQQEFIIWGLEAVQDNRPSISFIRNFTEMTDMKLQVASSDGAAKYGNWKQTVAANLPQIVHSWGDEPGCENIVICGSGPSLRNNWGELLKLDFSKTQVWAANEAYQFLAKRGVPVDCFFCIDATSPVRWVEGFDHDETTLVAAPFVNPAIAAADWHKRVWFNLAGNGFYPNLIRHHRPNLVEIDATRGVGSAMIESTWMKGVKRVVICGADFCYKVDEEKKEVWRSVDSCLNQEQWREFMGKWAHYVMRTPDGKPTASYVHLALESGAMFGAAQCLWEKGVRVINATEGGILRLNPGAEYLVKKQQERGSNVLSECSLRDAVELLNLS